MTPVTYFRTRKGGPEMALEDVVAEHIPNLFPDNGKPLWTAGSLPIGAGMPDLTLVWCEPHVLALTRMKMSNAHILAYLRAVGRARLDTIALRTRQAPEVVSHQLNGLIEAEVISGVSESFSLTPQWKEVLPEIVSVEVKVTNWQKALEQARRNCIFAHRSFIALPDRIAERIKSEQIFSKSGVGLLSVGDNNEVCILRRGRRHHPRVWTYYYQLAWYVARHFERGKDAFHYQSTRCSDGIS